MSAFSLLLLPLTLYLLLTFPSLPPHTLLHPTYPKLSTSPTFPPNTDLSLATLIQSSPSPLSPETAFPDPSTCTIYTTDARGLIWTLSPNHTSYTLHSTTGGTLLGGAIHPSTQSIYTCDATRGLLHIPSSSPPQIISAFVANDPNNRVSYCDDISIAPDNIIYFTSATSLHPKQAPHDPFPDAFATYISETVLGTRSGRVLAYDPVNRETRVIADGFAFANGIAVHSSGEFAIVAEMNTLTLWKVPLKGDQCGQKIQWAIMPGFPDGVSYDQVDDVFWVAVFTPVPKVLSALAKVPRVIRRLASVLPTWILGAAEQKSNIVAVDAVSGRVKRVISDDDGVLEGVTAVHRCKDTLWLGRLGHRSIAKLELGKLGKLW